MKANSRKAIQARVSRVSGQINGVSKMIDEDRYCLDTLNQISAVRAALYALGVELLTNHLESCVMGQRGRASRFEAAQQRGIDRRSPRFASAISEVN